MKKKISILFLFHLLFIFILKSQNSVIIPVDTEKISSFIEQNSSDSLNTGEIKTSFFVFLYCYNKMKILSAYKDKLKNLNTYIELHYKSGNISQLERSKLELAFYEAVMDRKNAQNELLIAENTLKKYIRSNADLVPSGKLTEKYCPFSFLKTGLDTDPDYETTNFLLKLEILNNKIDFYEKIKLNYASVAEKTIHASFEFEDAGLIDILHSLNEANTIQLEYIEIVKEYNLLAIDLLEN
jgi:hypothetical protein